MSYPDNYDKAEAEAYCIRARQNVAQSSMLVYLTDTGVLDALASITNKMVPIVKSSVNIPIAPTIKESVNTLTSALNNIPGSVDIINAKLNNISHNIHFDRMHFLANNYQHIINMHDHALTLLYNKVTDNSFLDYSYLPKTIPFLAIKFSVSACN
jgi:hypothetical protein